MKFKIGEFAKRKNYIVMVNSPAMFKDYYFCIPVAHISSMYYCNRKELKKLTKEEKLKVAIKYGF